jgi:TetR/AcrR family transcriptional regulator, regulator of biofilm formation and stress response
MDGREARGRASRAALIDAAVAVIGARGVEAVTHRVVAARAGLSVGLVTYHFATRDALLAATHMRLSAGNADEIAALARDSIDRGEPADEVMADHLELMLTTRRTAQSALFQLLLFAARQATEDDLPELAEESRKARGRIVAVIRPYTSSDDDARDLATALIGYTFVTLSSGVPVDSEDLHRFVRRQFAIYSVRGRAAAGSDPAPARGH